MGLKSWCKDCLPNLFAAGPLTVITGENQILARNMLYFWLNVDASWMQNKGVKNVKRINK
jgi:hypothetical protein